MHPCTSKVGNMNDKNAVMYDPFVNSVRNGLMKDYEFQLHDETVKGDCLLCDGGYRQWRCLQCPRQDTNQSLWALSRQMTAVCKDVECTFGILKGSWRMLKLLFEFEEETDVDNVFHTCCALHNQIQLTKGFHKMWYDEEHWTDAGDKFSGTHLGSRGNYVVESDTDFCTRELILEVRHNDGVCESKAWSVLGEALALNYDSMKRDRLIQWPRPMLKCK
jgi:hypothetical protein